jgi:hypothetical protein
MEAIKSFFDSFKEFIWDIIGYLLPGSFLLILLSSCVDNQYFINSSISALNRNYNAYIFIIISYLLGYVTYGFGWLKERILGKYSYVKKIEAKISKREAFSLAKDLIAKALTSKGVSNDLHKPSVSVRDIRSIAMSFIPEHDQKIYTFTFRSELSNQIANISIVVGFIGLVSRFSQHKIPCNVFHTGPKYIILYVSLFIIYFLLRETRNRFYAIAIGLPFSIYTAKMIK